MSISDHEKEVRDLRTQKDKCENEVGKAKADIQKKTITDDRNS